MCTRHLQKNPINVQKTPRKETYLYTKDNYKRDLYIYKSHLQKKPQCIYKTPTPGTYTC